MGEIHRWVNNNGDYTHRLNYKLNENSIVFDLGGYEGWFTEHINNKYNSKIFCFEPIQKYASLIQSKFNNYNNIFVFPMAISDDNKKDIIYINDNSSSMYIGEGKELEIECITLDKAMMDNNVDYIDLIKINIEGAEYDLFDYMINNKLIEKCNDIQVQFHDFIENSEIRYEHIKNELEKTHHLTYQYPFIWENWTINNKI